MTLPYTETVWTLVLHPDALIATVVTVQYKGTLRIIDVHRDIVLFEQPVGYVYQPFGPDKKDKERWRTTVVSWVERHGY